MIAKNDIDQPTQSSHLFMLRLWREDLGGGKVDWRGKVQHVPSGEVQYFRDWRSLEDFMEGLLDRIGPQGSLTDNLKKSDKKP